MRWWVGTPQIQETLGGRMLVGNRSDGFSVLLPLLGIAPERVRMTIDSYLDERCTCDSSVSGRACRVHREVGIA